MDKKTIKSKIQFFSILFVVVVCFLALCTEIVFSLATNKQNARNSMEQIAGQKNLEFQANLNSQIILALQMSKSPTIVDYMLDPSDPVKAETALKEFSVYQDSFLGKTSFWVGSNDLRFYSDLKYSYTVNPDNPDDYWYNMTVNETPVYNFNINYNKELNKTLLWLNVVVHDYDGKAIGIVGTGIPLTSFVEDMYKGISSDIQMFLYNDKLEITGAKDSSLLADKVLISKDYPMITEDYAVVKENVHLANAMGEYLIAPVEVIGWNLLIYSPVKIRNLFTKNGFLIAVIMICIAAVIIFIFNLLFRNILDTTTTHLSITKEKANAQVELMDQVNSTIAENIDYLGQFGELISRQINQIETSAENASELMGDLDAMNILRKDSQESTKDLAESSARGNEHLENISTKIEELNECTKRLSAANNLIASITSKTNLLAMNASIEASHAGEQGKGFAVVAKEIRALAEKSRTQQQDVSRAIDDINSMVSDMVSYSEIAQKSFDEIVLNTERVQSNFSNMSNKLESEASLVQTITANLSNVSSSNQRINSSFEEMKESNTVISKDISQAVDSSNELLVITDNILNSI